ncbi:regulator of sirC expression with transglutaminase-like and TPR domain [Nicoletella semolina]|uniref:Regulator of sirC expression with transglutaminase-like and TPR domain n=1 Tax=Nicoletella semolina TaxID=271160 RepID=A0A4R2N7F4_9PAST|nr:SirB1 family protein [Nicoletella semolina]MDH2924362.1 hypothetical protein [Nicoletella semolina]TCP16859.1 regulator of sirC expression with transglutaminase-like and TPR domain [Nicoletella semolina]
MDSIINELLTEVQSSKTKPKDLQQFLYRELLRLTLLLDEGLGGANISGKMSSLVRKARAAVNGQTDAQRIEQLLDLMYQEWGFCCHYDEYFFSENIFINHVLYHRRGMPVSLGAVMLYLASALNLPLYPVNFPTQLIIRAEIRESNGRMVQKFINPWDGSFITIRDLEKWLEGDMGYGVQVTRDMLSRAKVEDLSERLEIVFKMALGREGNYEGMLRIIEHRLDCSPDDPYEIRDRGMVLASLDCYQAALDDFNYFIDQCPEDPASALLKAEVPYLKKKSEEHRLH